MISLRKFLDLGEVGGAPAAPAAAGDLELALQQALRLMIENLPLHEGPGGDGDPRHRARLQRLASRLQSRLAPIDPMEIATEAIETCQLDKAEAEARFRQAERSWKERGDGELVLVLQQALQMLLEGLPPLLEDAGGSAVSGDGIAGLLERLAAATGPFDVLDVAGCALALMQKGADAAQHTHRRAIDQREESRRAAGRAEELCSASLNALRQVLDAAGSFADLPEQFGAQPSDDFAALRRRMEAPLTPVDVLGIASAVSDRLNADAAAVHRLLHEPAPAPDADPRLDGRPAGPAGPAPADGALASSLVQALQMVLSSLPVGGRALTPEGEARGEAMAQLVDRLGRTLDPFDTLEIAADALAILAQDAASTPAPAAGPADPSPGRMAEVLLDGLRSMIAQLPAAGDDSPQTRGAVPRAVEALLLRLDRPSSPEDVQGIVQEALAFSARGAKAAQLSHRRHTEELQAIIAMLSNTVAALVRHRAGSVARLQQIERRIEQASHAEDLFALKSLLADCLQELRENVESQRKQSDETLQVFERQLASARARLAGPAPAGPQEDDRRAASGPDGSSTELVVAFLLDREQSIASRFGGDVHQRVLRFVHERLRQSLLPSDRLVRWKSAVFLASLQRSGSWQEIRAELASVASIHAPPLIDLGSRSIRLPISLSWAVFPRQRFASLESLFQKVDDFVARTGNRPEA